MDQAAIRSHLLMHLEPDQSLDRVMRGVPLGYLLAVLEDALEQVRGHAGVKATVESVGQ